MARTEGHGNPDWTREETILALELYFENDGVVPSGSDSRIVALSNFLRSLPYHEKAARKPSFRNPDGVAFKIQNLRSLATGKGLKNVSATDRAVWNELGTEREKVRSLAAAIRQGVALVHHSVVPLEEEFSEGRALTQLHLTRERDARIRKRVIARALAGAGLRCAVCGFDGGRLPASLADAAFEVHHLIPLAEGPERKTRIEDMALVCACCHRLIHRIILRERRSVTLSEARVALGYELPEPS